jgi:uncharacterized membrane protein YukC
MTLGSPKHMEQCIHFTGEVAEEAAKLIVRELDLEVNNYCIKHKLPEQTRSFRNICSLLF